MFNDEEKMFYTECQCEGKLFFLFLLTFTTTSLSFYITSFYSLNVGLQVIQRGLAKKRGRQARGLAAGSPDTLITLLNVC